MRRDLDDQFSLNVSYSEMKRVKRFVLEKLEGGYIDDFNKLEAYAQELRGTNPDTDVMINISKEALEQEKKKIFKNICMLSSFEKWLERRNSLELTDGEGLTFMSAMQKGLLDVVSRMLPKVHHR
ncbi:hypothetical protein HAX54_040778 [Datura stramonium]|uniref:Uncharacterized protein n=1 Tax=Datura stramonium TaxID=4076 RepID=A0ABS8RNX8_DATST|nr:hypothetical protein [Datura stramonium]